MIEHILALALARSSTLRGRFLGFAPGMMDAIHTAKDSEQRATRMQLWEDEVPDQSMDFIKVGMDHSLLAQIGESHPCSTGGALVQPQNQQPQAMDKGWQY